MTNMTNQNKLKLAMVQTLSGLDLGSLEVTYSERIRTGRDLVINSKLNLMLTEEGTTILLCIEHRELDYGSSFSMEVMGQSGLRVGRMVLADTDLPVELVRSIDGLVAALPIVNRE